MTTHVHTEDRRQAIRSVARNGDLLRSVVAGVALLAAWVTTVLLQAPPAGTALALVAYLAGGWGATRHAVVAARQKRFDVDLLMVVAALGAAALGAWLEGALLLFLFSLGHALEHLAMDRARHAIRSLADLTPKTARVRREGLDREIAVAELRIGDLVVVRPGERLPADGTVEDGRSALDQAPITGESMPVGKSPGDAVFAGTINGDGALLVRANRAPEDTTLARVIRSVEEARSAKAPTQRFTDRIKRTLTPIVLVAAVLLIALPPLFGVPFGTSFLRAMTLLVAASPCALALATPSAVLAGIARAARSGVLIKGGAHLENTGVADVVVFDKTGTLTEGRPTLVEVVTGAPSQATANTPVPTQPAASGPSATDAHGVADASSTSRPTADEDALLALAAGVESQSGHPLAAAIMAAARSRGLKPPAVGLVENVTGRGVRAHMAGRPSQASPLQGAPQEPGAEVLLGNGDFLIDAGIDLPAGLEARRLALENAGHTVVWVALDGIARGLLALRDRPRANAAGAIRRLKQLGIGHTVMLTGDNAAVAEAIARELGVDEVHASLLPEQKAERVRKLQLRHGRVVMVGDGVNDAPAMAAADVAVAMGGAGNDVALETADVALMADDLSRLPYAVALSRASRRRIVQNLVLSLGVIVLLVPSAVLGVAGMPLAIALHEGSTLLVVANALRLLGYRDHAGRASLATT